MKDYFNRLKSHPGLGFATILTILGASAGASNKSFEDPVDGAIFGTCVMGGLVWSIVLLSNRK